MSLWTSSEAEAATGGTASKPWWAEGVSIDTRTMAPGDLFVALTDRRDGHCFVASAFARGAAAAMVSRVPDDVPEDAPLLVVEDVQKALEQLGRARRARSRAKIVAVTGSVGKTSTKEMLRHVLTKQGVTAAAEQSFNNHWGVPLTLARLPANSDYGVVEIGMNNPGEILPLARMTQPHTAVITRIGPVHLAGFNSIEGIAREKSSIFSGLVRGGTAIYNAGSPAADIMRDAAFSAGAHIVSFGSCGSPDWELLNVKVLDDCTVFEARGGGSARIARLAARGSHFAENALAVLAAVESLGADPVVAALDLGEWKPPAGRGDRHRVALGEDESQSIMVVDDAFNASPVSMKAAIEVLAATEPGQTDAGRMGRRVAILGDMLELGPEESEFHAGIADLASIDAVDVVHCAGPLMRNLHDGLPAGKRGLRTESAEEMAALAHQLVCPGDVVLVKGSKGSRISIVADAIRRLDITS